MRLSTANNYVIAFDRNAQYCSINECINNTTPSNIINYTNTTLTQSYADGYYLEWIKEDGLDND